MKFQGCDFACHITLYLIGVGTLEDAQNLHEFNSYFCLKIAVLHHFSELVLFKIFFWRHINFGYTNVFFVRDFFNDSVHTYVHFTMSVLNWYNFTS